VKLVFKESFARDLKAIRDKDLLARIRRVIESAEKATILEEISQIRKLREQGGYYRIRIGQYRIGLILEDGNVIFVRCLHRRDVYRYFP
jgi:mRNA interferase RelE/StbE